MSRLLTSAAVRRPSFLVITALAWALLATPARPQGLPADLELVPRDASAFISLRGAELWNSESLKDIRLLVDRAGPEAWKNFEKNCVPKPANIDRIMLLMLTPQTLAEPFPTVDPEAISALVVVTTKTPYNRLEVMQALGFREKLYRRHLYHFNEDLWSGLVLLDERTFLIGAEDSVVQFFDMMKDKGADGPLQAALRVANAKHPIVVGVNTQSLAKDKIFQAVPPNLQPLLEAQCGVLTVDLDKEINFDLRLNYLKDEQAQAGEKAVRALLDMAVAGITFPISEVENQLKQKSDKPEIGNVPETFAMVLALGVLREVEHQLKTAPVKRDGAVVRMPYQVKSVGPYQLSMVSLAAISTLGHNAAGKFRAVADTIGGGDRKNPHEEHLKVLANALERYHDAKGSYPPAAMLDKEGRPLLSWRVALLPYLGEDNLYKEFKLDEPWDSLHNKKLIKKLPKAFKSPDYSWRKGRTQDMVFTGENTIFDGKAGARKTDVDAKTIMLVLTPGDEEAIYWTKPADLSYADGKPLPNLFGKYYGQCHVLFADGTYRAVRKDTDEKVLRSLIKRKGPKEKLPGEKE